MKSVFVSYSRAIAAMDYRRSCDLLSVVLRREMSQLAPAQRGDGGCAAVLSGLLAPTAAATAEQQSRATVTKVRIGASRGFVVFRAPGATLYQMPIVRERGQWKLGLVAPSILVPSAETLGR